MKCFSEEQIQAFIDKELSQAENDGFEKHLKTCNICYRTFRQHKELVVNFKQTSNLLTDEHIIIPPINKNHAFKPARKVSGFRKLVYTLSAACILLLIMLVLNNGKQEMQNENALYNFNKIYVDANQPVTEQELVITAVNPNGDVTEYIIE